MKISRQQFLRSDEIFFSRENLKPRHFRFNEQPKPKNCPGQTETGSEILRQNCGVEKSSLNEPSRWFQVYVLVAAVIVI